MLRKRKLVLILALVTSCAGAPVRAENLAELDLATLMSMDVIVTSAARRAQSTEDAAAAVYVITREDIRRSAAGSIPELLRTVPGLQVARINTRSWAVTARGFNSQFANKLQVLVDGRSIYATIFSGVMWEEQFVPLERIERIEVVRGPGGALWGVNAVNGVINIITQGATEQPGLQASAGAGNHVSNAAFVRYGARSDVADVEVYADHTDADPYTGDVNDLRRSLVGVRIEHSGERDHFTIHGEYADSDFGEPSPTAPNALPPNAIVGGAALDWRRRHASGSQSEATAYYAVTDRGQPGAWDEENFGMDVQHSTPRRGRHLATVGAGFRHVHDQVQDDRAREAFTKTAIAYDLWSVYAQDETFWFDDRVRLILGAKVEEFRYTGLEFQPTLRALWHASPAHTFWGAASRAARTPSRFELHTQISIPIPSAGSPTMMSIAGTEDLEAEQLNAYELGWRWRPGPQFTFDLTAFHHEYDELIMQTPLEPVFTGAQLLLPLVYANAAQASTRGAELAFEWRALDRLRLHGTAHWLELDLPPVSAAINAFGSDPQYAWSLHTRFDASPAIEFDLGIRGVAEIENLQLPGYESVDVRLGWRATPTVELSAAVENVFDDEHVEFFDEVTRGPGAVIGRSAFMRINWRMR